MKDHFEGSGMSKRKTYTAESKREAVRLAETNDKTQDEVERDPGLWRGYINGCKRQLAEEGEEAVSGQGRLNESDQRIRDLECENEILRQERETLKKAVTIFSQPRQ